MSRRFALVCLPAICFLWFIGWSLFWIGERNENKPPLNKEKGGNSAE
jgi:hypothetical protein